MLNPTLFLILLGLTSLVYVLTDLFPIQAIGPFKDFQARVIVQLWQALVWAAYYLSTSFIIYYFLGLKHGLTQSSLTCFITQNFGEYITAQLRILIRVSLWFFALVIPGFIMDARYKLTTLFILFHPHFHEDRSIDPLELSLKSVPLKRMGWIALIVLLTTICPWIIDGLWPHASLLYEPQGRLLQILFYSLLYLFTYAYLFKTYLDIREGKYV